MPQSLARVYLHIVFSTKHREPWLADVEVRRRLYGRISGLCRGMGSPVVDGGGVADHVHILGTLSRTLAMAELVKEIKRITSMWLKDEYKDLPDFAWQEGYGSFSVSPSHVPVVEKYIRGQEKRHRTQTFKEEYRQLLEKHGIEYDERYVWD